MVVELRRIIQINIDSFKAGRILDAVQEWKYVYYGGMSIF